MTGFTYKCPECGATNILHDENCEYEYTEIREFERCYTDILAVLIDYGATMAQYDMDEAMDIQLLIKKVEQLPNWNNEQDAEDEELMELESVSAEDAKQDIDPPTQNWTQKHWDCLNRLKNERRLMETDDGIRLTEEHERAEQIIPNFEPLRTIYAHGPVDGAKDYSVYTMVSWCSLKEMSWEQTVNFLTEWLEESNAWERESWGESSINELLSDKKHVWANDLGWGDMADVAKHEIESSNVDPQIDVDAKVGKEATDYGVD